MPYVLPRPKAIDPPPSLGHHLLSSVAVATIPAGMVWGGIAATQGAGAALLAMQSQAWLLPLLTLASWAGSKVYDVAKAHFGADYQATIDSNRRAIDALKRQLVELESAIVALNATIEELNMTIEDDKATQLDLRAQIADLQGRLAHYEGRTPDPDGGIGG